MATTQPFAHPLHPSMVSRIDPEYAAFHHDKLLYHTHCHEVPWSPAVRSGPAVPGGSAPVPIGSVKDYSTSDRTPWLRVFTPEGDAPEGGWPALVYYHGGGWTLGNIHTENSFCSQMCKYAKAVVIHVDYRLAPEHPYPAAVEDALESLVWVYNKGSELLTISPSRIAVGGSSSGGNLAAVAALKAPTLNPPVPLTFQLLIVPVTDNTATPTGEQHASWKENEHTTWLSAARMMWFQDRYLPNVEDRTRWDNSPLLAPSELFAKCPPAWFGICELDVLRDEGLAYAEKLKAAGVACEIEVYKGCPHPIMAMDGKLFRSCRRPLLITTPVRARSTILGVLSSGKRMVNDAAAALRGAFGTSVA